MTIHDYLEEDILILTASSIVEHFQIVKRRDNARHHSELMTFPYHIHLGSDGNVNESANVDMSKVLQVLESEIEQI